MNDMHDLELGDDPEITKVFRTRKVSGPANSLESRLCGALPKNSRRITTKNAIIRAWAID
jgi:hypothetical protein